MLIFRNPYPNLFKLEISPAIQGSVSQYGRPIPHVKVQRRIYYAGKLPRIHNIRTNILGNFSFKPYTLASRAPSDPAREQFISLAVHVFLGSPPKTIWESTLVDIMTFPDQAKTMLSQLNYDIDNEACQFELPLSQQPDNNSTMRVYTECHQPPDELIAVNKRANTCDY